MTASAAASVDDLAPGRVYIGIGAGGTGVWHLGMKTASLALLEEYVVAVRQLLAEGEAEYRGETVRLPWAAGRRIPIVVSAHGPQALRVAGRVGDGVIVGLGVTPEVVSGSLELLEEGAQSAGRSAADLDVVHVLLVRGQGARCGRAAGAWAATAFAPLRALGRRGPLRPGGAPERGGRVPAYDLVTHGAVPPEQQEHYARLADELGVGEYLGGGSSSPARPTRSRPRSGGDRRRRGPPTGRSTPTSRAS